MFSAKLISLLGATAAAIDFDVQASHKLAGDDASNYCPQDTMFCARTREFKIDQMMHDGRQSDLSYSIDPDSIIAKDGTLKAKLAIDCGQPGYLAPELDLTLNFYQNGIMRAEIDTPRHDRFQISQEGLPVVWD